jgi:Rrf2 family protein
MLGEYAIRAMIHLAGNSGHTVVNISEISSAWDIPEALLRKIIPRLSRAGLINTIRGHSGGISLARDASLITPLEIIECIEGEIILNPCLVDTDVCSRTEYCAMHLLWDQARDQLRQTLCSVSLSQLAEKKSHSVTLSHIV